MFVDRVKVHVRSGRGGNGVTSFARQPYEPRGRPDGGDGGRGGDVVVRASGSVATLLDCHHRPHRKAGSGRHGEGDLRRGASAADEVVVVPVGTVVRDQHGRLLGDLLAAGDSVVVARGGRGGRGNAALRSSARRAPRFHEFGEEPEERWVVLELKLVADVALVGFPNAGKSSLIARLSAARPKVADYPFTTLAPNLGVVQVGDGGRGVDAGGAPAPGDIDFVVADVPGLVEGASQGRGLGHEFLRHVERAGCLVHVLDCASYEQRDPREDLDTVLAELRAYEQEVELPAGMRPLTRRPALVWLNKTDADPEVAEIVRPDIEARGFAVLAGSAATGAGLEALRYRLAGLVAGARAERADAAAGEQAGPRPVVRPARAAQDFRVRATPEGFAVRGERVERWVRMTDLGNDEAVRYLQGRLARAGVERALVEAGARAGDAVEIAGFVFDFEPEPADLPEADRDGADLPEADRDGADLPEADRDGADLPEADRDGADPEEGHARRPAP